jgi:hypothetical protein
MSRYVRVTEVTTGGGTQSTASYNAAVRKWGRQLRGMVKKTATAFTKGKMQQRGEQTHVYKSGPKAGKEEGRLVNNLSMQYKKDVGDEIDTVSLKLLRHGIFREYGVGNGTPKSKVGMTRRTKSPWVSEPLEQKEGELVKIAAEHGAEMVVRAFRVK